MEQHPFMRKTEARCGLSLTIVNHVTASTADSDMCADQLPKWRHHRVNVAELNLRKAYLQISVDQELWLFQTTIVQGQRYCLRHIEFRLSLELIFIKAVIKTILAQDLEIKQTVVPYMDNLLVDEDQVSTEKVSAHLASFRQECKQQDSAVNKARLLGLHMQPAGGRLLWTSDKAICSLPTRLTHHAVFTGCGQLIA